MPDYVVAMDSQRDNARVNRATQKGLNLRVERMVKLAKPIIRGTNRTRREVSLRFNALLSLDRRIHSLHPSKFAKRSRVCPSMAVVWRADARVWAAWTGDSLAISNGLTVLAPSVASRTNLI